MKHSLTSLFICLESNDNIVNAQFAAKINIFNLPNADSIILNGHKQDQ